MLHRVLLLLLDDVGPALLLAANTPNLDAVAAAGARFVNAWGAPNCSAARAELVSGHWTLDERNRVFGIFGHKAVGELPDATRNPYTLGNVAISSAWIGKWHLAQHDRLDHPARCGFHVDGSVANLSGPLVSYTHWPRNLAGTLGWVNEHATEYVAEQALLAVRARTPLVVAAFNACHEPFHYPKGWTGPADDEWAMRVAMLEHVDAQVGPLVTWAAREGFHVIVTADQAGTVADGGKGTLRESTLNVPLWIAGPTISRRGVFEDLVTLPDLHATVWTLLTGKAPVGTDGQDILDGERRAYSFADLSQQVDGALPRKWDRAVRSVRWKAIVHDYVPESAGVPASWGQVELYDLERDPREETDVAGDHRGGELDELLEALLRVTP